MYSFLVRYLKTRNLAFILISIGLYSVLTANDPKAVLILMSLAYLSNLTYSGVSRSAVRNSATYHACTLFLSNVVFYSVLYRLKLGNLSLELFIPYTVATVFGSISGAQVSAKVEEYFGITTSTDKVASTRATMLAKKIVLGIASILVVIAAITSKDLLQSFYVAALVFGGGVSFSLVRRSRNSDNTTYHIFAFLFDSFLWFLLYRNLNLNGLALVLFPAYSLGSITGGLTGQKVSEWLERLLGTSADAHLTSGKRLMPWRSIAALIAMSCLLVTVAPNKQFISYIAILALGQQISFSLVSRSRNRANLTYHMIASVFSNGVWFLTYRQMNNNDWNWRNYPVYATGGSLGSVTGVGISMNIEKALNITSDSKPASKPSPQRAQAN
jgi:hypothetical protein